MQQAALPPWPHIQTYYGGGCHGTAEAGRLSICATPPAASCSGVRHGSPTAARATRMSVLLALPTMSCNTKRMAYCTEWVASTGTMVSASALYRASCRGVKLCMNRTQNTTKRRNTLDGAGWHHENHEAPPACTACYNALRHIHFHGNVLPRRRCCCWCGILGGSSSWLSLGLRRLRAHTKPGQTWGGAAATTREHEERCASVLCCTANTVPPHATDVLRLRFLKLLW